MCTTLIVPGLNGSCDAHWQGHWLRERPESRLVDQENWACPVLEDWRDRLEAALEATDGAYIVAHSLGCILTASLAGRASARKVKGALLVAPADLDRVEALHPCIVSFGTRPLDPLPFRSIVVGSRNDPYMDVRDLQRHANAWDSALVDLGEVGHINVASGFGRWEEGYRIFDRLARQTTGIRKRRSVHVADSGFGAEAS
ncbi:alpha/beta hydrolase [Rhizobiaceae bacterium BDR2-2]|uniref:Alpha/beta hydrolase n=1 Tax=Ectorhizobium quercum TaxID=2965071 RepID=A0AAE3N045_9HYPH|nr:alpha/beta hydrolase [Ectorhizobium quercum]MCX8998149.1 alpha/beta hydrolase [Ectorhizobium quercum]